MAPDSARLVARVRETLRGHAMLAEGARVLVAVSGGPDSVCLLHVLARLGHGVEAAHLDHGTRGGASAGDAAFVRTMTARWGVPLHERVVDVPAGVASSRRSFEHYARDVRYAFLVDCARAVHCDAVATGHHAGDQAETLLLRLLRGTSPAGLAGIPPVRTEGGVRIVRPLLDCTRADILAYLEAEGLDYRVDASNADPGYLRNRIRHELLPALAHAYNPRLPEGLTRLAALARDEDALLEAQAADLLAVCVDGRGVLLRAPFAHAHPALQRRAILQYAWRHGVAPGFDEVEAARRLVAGGATGAACDLGGRALLRVARTTAEVETGAPAAAHSAPSEVALAVPGLTAAFGRLFRVTCGVRLPHRDIRGWCSPVRQVFDARAVAGGLSVRPARPGDRFTPLGMGGSRKLQDYGTDLGLSRRERAGWLVLTAGGRIAWIVGHALDGRAAITADTEAMVLVEVLDAG